MSCSAECYRHEATLCLSRNCLNCSDISQFENVSPETSKPEGKKRSIWTESGVELTRRCKSPAVRCNWNKNPECCGTPNCNPPSAEECKEKKGKKKKRCKNRRRRWKTACESFKLLSGCRFVSSQKEGRSRQLKAIDICSLVKP